MARQVGSRDQHLALTVHGPLGSIDLSVPPGAAATDVAREYAAQAGLGSIPLIYTELGDALPADIPLVDGGVDSGDVLRREHDPLPAAARFVSGSPAAGTRRTADESGIGGLPGVRRSRCWPAGSRRWTPRGGLLALARRRGRRARWPAPSWACCPSAGTATSGRSPLPAFAGAAAFALVGETDQEKLPIVLGIAGLAAAVAAAVARAPSTTAPTPRPGSGSSRVAGCSCSPDWQRSSTSTRA